MKQDWQTLMQLTQNQEITISRVELANSNIAIEGKFELPPLANLSLDDQVFVASFIGVHGSIKEMEKLFGISYPTVKARLKKISEQLNRLGLIVQGATAEINDSILDRLASREITVDEAIEELRQCSH